MSISSLMIFQSNLMTPHVQPFRFGSGVTLGSSSGMITILTSFESFKPIEQLCPATLLSGVEDKSKERVCTDQARDNILDFFLRGPPWFEEDDYQLIQSNIHIIIIQRIRWYAYFVEMKILKFICNMLTDFDDTHISSFMTRILSFLDTFT